MKVLAIMQIPLGNELKSALFHAASYLKDKTETWVVISRREDGTPELESGPQASRRLAEIEMQWIKEMEDN